MAFGWTIALVSLISIPAGAVHSIITEPKGKTLYQVNKLVQIFLFDKLFYQTYTIIIAKSEYFSL